jgi:hypothetical protein
MNSSDRAELIFREVVTGRRHWSAIQGIGLRVSNTAAGLAIDAPPGFKGFTISPAEVAEGLERLRDKEDELKAWAFIIKSNVNVENFEQIPGGEWLFDLLWEVSFGKRVTDDDLARVRSLALA